MTEPEVLVVDDEAELLAIICSLLKRANIHALAANSPDAALSLWRQHSRHLAILLTDCVMPGLSGHELATKFLAEKPELKVIFMSGNVPAGMEGRLPMEPGVNVLQKPFRPLEMIQAVKQALQPQPGATPVS